MSAWNPIIDGAIINVARKKKKQFAVRRDNSFRYKETRHFLLLTCVRLIARQRDRSVNDANVPVDVRFVSRVRFAALDQACRKNKKSARIFEIEIRDVDRWLHSYVPRSRTFVRDVSPLRDTFREGRDAGWMWNGASEGRRFATAGGGVQLFILMACLLCSDSGRAGF